MSKENNFSSSSLCTTEDAFEKFQAGALYEDDEFITLSDIVPPQPEVPDLSNELNEIPYDNEVVLISTNDEDMPLNSNIESSQHPDNEHKQQSNETFDKININQKKGRKKKNSIQNNTNLQSDSSYLETENNSFLDNQAVQDNVLSTIINKNGIESNNFEVESQYPRRTRRERVPNTTKYPLITETIINEKTPSQGVPAKRRGRPKKVPIEISTISEPDSSNIDTSLVSENSSYSENGETVSSKETPVKRRRGRPKASQASFEQMNPIDTSSNISKNTDTDLPLVELKKPTRRGRKKISDTIEKPASSIRESENINDPVDAENGISQFDKNKITLNENEDVLESIEESLLKPDEINVDDDGDDVCLSKLKENITNITDNLNDTIGDKSILGETKTINESSTTADFEHHIDKIVQETPLESAGNLDNNGDESLLVEDTSKRPNRRNVKQNFKYSLDSDEDPFADVELSEDDEPKPKRKGRYADDDDYYPGKKQKATSVTSSSDSDLYEEGENLKNIKSLKRRRIAKITDSLSPSKRGRKRKSDIELCVDTIDTDKTEDEPLSMKPPAEAWATSNEFENFIAQKIQGSSSLKIKKVSSKQKTDNVVTPLDIPILKQNEPKKCIEIGSQTDSTPTTSTGMQTSVPYDIPMKVNMGLTPQQSEKACRFLNSVVKTTAELGQLMKEKSEDFMKKKINIDSVTDTFKMDYCVRKSFLLFKLAKHNLLQMEEDLAKQYDEFLRSNNLSSCREEVKNITPTQKIDNDSDCEIVDIEELPSTSANNEKPKLNKTVFLNKELSIKIAKKPSGDKNVDVKGRHTIWINDSVMVKKVKPTQSFLAQDSRNKKPPDYITEKMVSDFFKTYYHQRAVAICAPYISTEWSSVQREYACHYFVKCNDFDDSDLKNSEVSQNMIEMNASTSNTNCNDPSEILGSHKNNPKSLASLCTEVIRRCLYVHNVKGANEDLTCDLTDGKSTSGPLSLFRLCYQSIQKEHQQHWNMSNKPPILNEIEEKTVTLTAQSLKSLCCDRIAKLIPLCDDLKNNDKDVNKYDPDLSNRSSYCEDILLHDDEKKASQGTCTNNVVKNKDVKSLLLLTIRSIHNNMFGESVTTSRKSLKICRLINQDKYINSKTRTPKPLKVIVHERIKKIMFDDKLTSCFHKDPIYHTEEICHDKADDFTINCINTMSEEAFHSLEVADEFEDEDDYDFEPATDDFGQDNEGDGNEWASQVQMQVLRSCVTPANNLSDNECDEMSINNYCITPPTNTVPNEFASTNTKNYNQLTNTPLALDNINIFSQIKLEPQDEIAENIVDSSIVKIEPVHGLDEMTIIPESIVTKSEIMEHDHTTGIEAEESERETSGYDVNTFEQFVRINKRSQIIDEDSDDEQIFNQSAMRIRREHEPDYDAENDMNESLLIPHTYEPLHIDNAKGVLMESSSDEARKGPKKQSKKKRKQKKVKEIAKTSNTKEILPPTKIVPVSVKDKASNNEVAVLTRRMREKIRQEEKKIESSDSESDIALSSRKETNKAKENEKIKSAKSSKHGEPSSTKNADNEIQCNNVDSTDQMLDNKPQRKVIPNEFTGFSAIDQNEISSYHKYMQFVYDKIIPTEDDNSIQENADINVPIENSNRSNSPLINPDQPVELLECEPSMPIFDYEVRSEIEQRPKKGFGKKKESKLGKDKSTFIERDGWHLYSINTTDAKLYQKCHIPLEKLPESFVETYLEYHNITDRDNIDKEVDRLANLQSLNRATTIKDGKSKLRQKPKSATPSEQHSDNVSRVASPANSDCLEELMPSDDEGANVDNEVAPPVPVRATENILAKGSLMDDHDSDSDSGIKKIKSELKDDTQVEEPRRPGPKSKTKLAKPNVEILPSESLMLTADKMMNKELTLLNTPVVMKEEAKEVIPKEVLPKEPSSKEETKSKKRSTRSMPLRERLKTEDDSSSEEEKQWVSTKEKLLKRIGKKEDATVEDAKRAKLVDDFIERRGEGPENRRISATRTSRRSRKKMLEKLKQQRVLSKELLGEPSTDLTPGGKRGANAGLFKGRRNIRKVIDKKSLQKSTVLANMEEFERKRRLNSKLNQLRELLGCEEGVNVLVINDEVCLEYDFQEQRPVVTVHPFFTKVMKAHQYEGVKFMWDACFESLASIEAGHGGGGCILAHCMGLGKTLQVLALLHTVLTHPRAGMHRVLVCCPLSTVLNWVDEIHKWIGPVTDQIKVFELSKLKKTYERAYQLEDWYNGGGIFIIGYELFRSLTTLDPLIDEVRPTIINKIRTALLDPGPDIIICDEGHLLKNDCSVLAVAMSRVVTKRRIVLTGTPMQNNLREYYCMVNFVKPNLLGTYSEYSNRFENPIMNGQHRDSREEDTKLMKARTHILHKVLEGCLQRQEASVLYPYLPKKHEYTVFIPLTKCQWDLYKHYVHHYTKKSKQSILRDFHILQKIWSHPLVLHNFSTREKKKEIKAEKLEDDLALEDKEDIKPPATETWWLQYLADGAMLDSIDTSNKFVAVFRILHECIALGDKVLIFSTSLYCLDALESFLRQINGWNLGQEYYRLDGSVPAEVRQKWVREFNAENNLRTKLFLISTRAGCLGLNMTAANRVIILDTSWNPAHDIQSIFRVYRFGQKKDCYIYRLVAMGTMEQKIYERSVTKQAVACRVVDEQQIDRHYNMAELTELYRIDEHGVGVAGGVAVGVGDVALLRVARDAAIHAVHEHDSLLRGSGEQGLPEHERAAAWMQFQQEHARKQMQNDMETDMAERALKKLQEKELLRLQLEQQQQLELQQLQQRQLEQQQKLDQQQEVERQQAQMVNIKTEDGPVQDLLVPRAEQPSARGRGGAGRGRGKRKANIVQCRIPIRADSEQPGPSQAPPPMEDEDMVQQISELLIKYNYTESKKGPKHIQQLVAKVKEITQSRQATFEGCDELTASIASVLMQRQNTAPAARAPAAASTPASAPPIPMPALTDVAVEPRRRGRPRKPAQTPQSEAPLPPPPTFQPRPEPEVETGGRMRRRAALAAELQFDVSDDGASQDSVIPDSVIELEDDDWHAAHTDSDSGPERAATPAAKEKKPQLGRKNKLLPVSRTPAPPVPVNPDDSSILLSDDEPSPPSPPLQATAKSRVFSSGKEKVSVKPKAPLHPSLLSNQNFIKIVAHTYLAGNPMLDEDAATLAAQYSTYKLLTETETSGKPIDSGPIYDIAIKVLGEQVLEKLQKQPSDPKSKNSGESNAASSKMAQFLGQDVSKQDAAPSPAPVKKRPGPKSRVKPTSQSIKREQTETPKPVPTTQNRASGVVPISLMQHLRSGTQAAPSPAPPAQADECILPDDDDDVRCVTEPPPPSKPVSFKVKLPVQNEQATSEVQKDGIRVTSSGNPAPAPPAIRCKAMTTICLDSDDDEPVAVAAAPARATRTTRTLPAQYSSTGGPVPVALTGPDSQPIPLAGPAPAPAPPPPRAPTAQPPAFYPYPTAVRYPPEPVPVSLTGPDSRPVPISLTGPDNRPVPISLTGPGFQAMPISYAGMSQGSPMTFAVPSSAGDVRPVAMTYSGAPQPPPGAAAPAAGAVRTVRLSLAPGQASAALHQMANNIYILPAAAAGDRVLTRVPPSQVSSGIHLQAPPAPPAVQTLSSNANATYCKPGDLLRLTPSGKLEIVKPSGNATSNLDVIHTIDDDEQSAPAPKAPTAKTAASKTSAPKTPAPKTPAPKAPAPKTPAPKTPAPKTYVPKTPTSKTPVSNTPALKMPQLTPIVTPTTTTAPTTRMRYLRTPPSKTDDQERRKRKVSSSSSSSDSSRSDSPSPSDPLALFKDVVHIQAPTKSKTNQSTFSKSDTSKPTKDDPVAKKLSAIMSTIKSKKAETSGAVKATNSKTVVANDSIDLTETSVSSTKSGDTKKNTTKGGKTASTAKKNMPTTVVGTSKSIILDGKSKSLTNRDIVDASGKKMVHTTNAKTLPSSANKPKQPEKKRPAPPAEATVPKKKKTEPMTLKDFDIDDIDDIIELD